MCVCVRERERERDFNRKLPWSKSSPKGLEEFVRLACFPSTASKVWQRVQALKCQTKEMEEHLHTYEH